MESLATKEIHMNKIENPKIQQESTIYNPDTESIAENATNEKVNQLQQEETKIDRELLIQKGMLITDEISELREIIFMKEQELAHIKKELGITIFDEVKDYFSNSFSYLTEKWNTLGSSESVKSTSDVFSNWRDKISKNESYQKTVETLTTSTDLATSGLQKATSRTNQAFRRVGESLIGSITPQNPPENITTSKEPKFVVEFEGKLNTVESESYISDSDVKNVGGTNDSSQFGPEKL